MDDCHVGRQDTLAEEIEILKEEQHGYPVLRRSFENQYADIISCSVICLNCVLVTIETDRSVNDADLPAWLETANHVFAVYYTVEALLRMCAYGRDYWKDAASIIDFAIVSIDDLFILMEVISNDDIFPSVTVLRLVRLLRLSRANRLMRSVPEFYIQVESLLGALKPMVWGLLFVFFTLYVFSIVGVNLIHPINQEVAAIGLYDGCQRCPHAFESVGKTFVTLSQHLLSGDSWGTISVPIIEHKPWTAIYFCFAYVFICLALTNVILASVVESANDARDKNHHLIASQKDEERRDAQKELVKICSELDNDASMRITKEELTQGLRSNTDLINIMKRMEIGNDEIDVVWQILDADNSNSLDYREFAEQLYKLRCADSHTLLVYIKFHLLEIKQHLDNEILSSIREMLNFERHEEETIEKLINIERHEEEAIQTLTNLIKASNDNHPEPDLLDAHTESPRAANSGKQNTTEDLHTGASLGNDNVRIAENKNQSLSICAGSSAEIANGYEQPCNLQVANIVLNTNAALTGIGPASSRHIPVFVQKLQEQQKFIPQFLDFLHSVDNATLNATPASYGGRTKQEIRNADWKQFEVPRDD